MEHYVYILLNRNSELHVWKSIANGPSFWLYRYSELNHNWDIALIHEIMAIIAMIPWMMCAVGSSSQFLLEPRPSRIQAPQVAPSTLFLFCSNYASYLKLLNHDVRDLSINLLEVVSTEDYLTVRHPRKGYELPSCSWSASWYSSLLRLKKKLRGWTSSWIMIIMMMIHDRETSGARLWKWCNRVSNVIGGF